MVKRLNDATHGSTRNYVKLLTKYKQMMLEPNQLTLDILTHAVDKVNANLHWNDNRTCGQFVIKLI